MAKANTGRSLSFANGDWHEGNPMILGPRHHAVWLASVAFDGARAFDGVAPDLERHSARAIRSAQLLGLAPKESTEEIVGLSWEGIGRFPAGTPLYICPMFYATEGFVVPDPDSAQFALSIYESPLPEPVGFSTCLSSFRRPARDMAPTEAKASCLYPNVARVGREAAAKGFDTGVVLDPNGNVAEFAYMNLFFANGGEVHTPAPNGTFLNGITRQRVVGLLRQAGVTVVERACDYSELLDADEIFATGNYAKVQPCARIEDRELQPGPLYHQARTLYFEFARGGSNARSSR